MACLVVTGLRIHDGAYIAIQTHLRVDEILAGACVATVYRSSWPSFARYPTVLATITATPVHLGKPRRRVASIFETTPLPPCWRLCCATATRSLRAFGLAADALRLSVISYAFYVVHPLTIYGWFNQGTVVERYLLKRPISFLMTFAAAHVSTFTGRSIGCRRDEIDPSKTDLA